MRTHRYVLRGTEVAIWIVAVLTLVATVLWLARPISGVEVMRLDENEIVAPCEGFFYRAEYPGEPPLVEVGDVVTYGTIVAYVQGMERVPVVSETHGTVLEILHEEMDVVAANEPLMRVAVK